MQSRLKAIQKSVIGLPWYYHGDINLEYDHKLSFHQKLEFIQYNTYLLLKGQRDNTAGITSVIA